MISYHPLAVCGSPSFRCSLCVVSGSCRVCTLPGTGIASRRHSATRFVALRHVHGAAGLRASRVDGDLGTVGASKRRTVYTPTCRRSAGPSRFTKLRHRRNTKKTHALTAKTRTGNANANKQTHTAKANMKSHNGQSLLHSKSRKSCQFTLDKMEKWNSDLGDAPANP